MRPNKELTLNSQQPVDDTLKKVDLMVRYYNTVGLATALFLVEAKRSKQTPYSIEQLELQLHDYTSFLFSPEGVARNQLVVYGGVVYGPCIRIYRISKPTKLSKPVYVDMDPIWGGGQFEQEFYRDVRKSNDAQEILNASKEIASSANYALGTTATGIASIPSLNHASTPFGASILDRPSSSTSQLVPSEENKAILKRDIDQAGKAYYICSAPDNQFISFTEWVEDSSWKRVSPSKGSKYRVNSVRKVWAYDNAGLS